jgi:hypothetical protein
MIAASEGIKSAAEQERLMKALMQHMRDVRGLSADTNYIDDDEIK